MREQSIDQVAVLDFPSLATFTDSTAKIERLGRGTQLEVQDWFITGTLTPLPIDVRRLKRPANTES